MREHIGCSQRGKLSLWNLTFFFPQMNIKYQILLLNSKGLRIRVKLTKGYWKQIYRKWSVEKKTQNTEQNDIYGIWSGIVLSFSFNFLSINQFFPCSPPLFSLTEGKQLCHFSSYQQVGWDNIFAAYLLNDEMELI